MIGIEEIRRMLPHRYPMLLVDRVVEFVPPDRVTALKAVTVNEPWYAGLPDGAPRAAFGYPSVLVIESWCQAASLLAAWEHRGADALAGRVALFGGLSGVRLDCDVLPGDVLEHHVRLARALDDTWIFEGDTTAGGRTVLRVERVMTALRPADALQRPAPVLVPDNQEANRDT